MRNGAARRSSPSRRNPDPAGGSGENGSVLIYIIVVMMVFGLLGAAMVAMFSSATMMSTGTPNYARQARYLSESGMRYAASELRTAYDSNVIQELNDLEYTLAGSGQFDLNVFGKWFKASADHSGTSDISLSVPEGEAPGEDIFAIPAGAYLVNLESYRDSFFFGGGTTKEAFVTQIGAAPALAEGATAVVVAAGDAFSATAAENHRMLLAARPAADQSVSAGNDLTITYQNSGAWNFFPKENGSFYIVGANGDINRYYYQRLEEVSSTVFSLSSITGTAFPLNVSQTEDLVILTERNHSIGATGSTVGAASGGSLNLAADFRPNTVSPQPIPPPAPGALPADVSPSDFASDDTATHGSEAGTVSVDTSTPGEEKVVLGGDVGGASSAAWFGGDVSLGGLAVCTDGTCGFNDGVRVFFIFDYDGDGDGFTFTLASGSQNATDAYGAAGEYMGYAGVSAAGKQIDPPKLALEFDTYTNAARNDPDGGNKDYVQYVYWGDAPGDVWDDNTHGTGGGATEKWPARTLAGSNVRNKAAVNPDTGDVYITNDNTASDPDGFVFGLDADTGSNLFSPINLLDNSYTSPVIGATGTVFAGSDFNGYNPFGGLNPAGGDINAIRANGSFLDYVTVLSDVRTSPAVDRNDVVYFGTNVNDDNFYAFRFNGSSFSQKWSYSLGPVDVPGTAALSPDESTVYFVCEDPFGSTTDGYTNFFLYALNTADGSQKWRFNLLGPSESSPAVAANGTVYVASDGVSNIGHLFAVNPDGSQKWRYDFSPTNPRTRPAVGADGTIYIGNDDNYLYAVTSNGSLKWRFETGDDVRSSPLVHEDGTIWFGSDDNNLYIVDANGEEIDRIYLNRNVRSAPAQGPDGSVYVGSDDDRIYAFYPACPPRNSRALSHPAEGETGPGDGSDDWLNSGPWAARLEILRSRTANGRGRYEYTMRMWLRQCADSQCLEDTDSPANPIAGTYFQDTRVTYDPTAHPPDLEQTIELCPGDHTDLSTFIFGFTQGTGSAVQTITVSGTELGFIRPGDFTITTDPAWQ